MFRCEPPDRGQPLPAHARVLSALAVAVLLFLVGGLATPAIADDGDGDDGDGALASQAWRSPVLTVAEHRLFVRLGHRLHNERQRARDELVGLEADRFLVAVREGLGHPNVRVRRAVALAIGDRPEVLEDESCRERFIALLAEDFPASRSPCFDVVRATLLRLGEAATPLLEMLSAEPAFEGDPGIRSLHRLLGRQRVLDRLAAGPVPPRGAFFPSPRCVVPITAELSDVDADALFELLEHPQRFEGLHLPLGSLGAYQSLAALVLGEYGRAALAGPDRNAVRARMAHVRDERFGEGTFMPSWRFTGVADVSRAVDAACFRLGDTGRVERYRASLAKKLEENTDRAPSTTFLGWVNLAWTYAWAGDAVRAIELYAEALHLADNDDVATTIGREDLAEAWSLFARALATLSADTPVPPLADGFPRPPAGVAALVFSPPETCRKGALIALQTALALGHRGRDWLLSCGDFASYAGDEEFRAALQGGANADEGDDAGDRDWEAPR